MTDREKAIVMAHTGVCMLTGDKFQIFHKYIEDIMGRPVFIHELGYRAIEKEIKEKTKDDFMALCADESSTENPNNCDLISREWLKTAIHNFYYGLTHTPTEEDIQAYIDAAPSVSTEKTGHWIDRFPLKECNCSECDYLIMLSFGTFSEVVKQMRYCPNCGAKMVESEDKE